MLSGTASSSSRAPAVSPAPLQRSRSLVAPRLAPSAPAIAPRRPESEQSRATRRGDTMKAMATTDDDAGGSAEAPSPSAPSAAAPNVAELVMLMKVRDRCKGQKREQEECGLGPNGCPNFEQRSIPKTLSSPNGKKKLNLSYPRFFFSLSPVLFLSRSLSLSKTDRPGRGRQRRARRALVGAVPGPRDPLRVRGGDSDGGGGGGDERGRRRSRRRDSSGCSSSLFPLTLARFSLLNTFPFPFSFLFVSIPLFPSSIST